MKVGLLIIATGKYNCFFDDLYKSCEENFLQGIEKVYFYFTDDMTTELPNNVIPFEAFSQRLAPDTPPAGGTVIFNSDVLETGALHA